MLSIEPFLIAVLSSPRLSSSAVDFSLAISFTKLGSTTSHNPSLATTIQRCIFLSSILTTCGSAITPWTLKSPKARLTANKPPSLWLYTNAPIFSNLVFSFVKWGLCSSVKTYTARSSQRTEAESPTLLIYKIRLPSSNLRNPIVAVAPASLSPISGFISSLICR